MGFFSKKPKKETDKSIHAMLVMVVHPDTTMMEPPGNVREFCTNVAGDILPGVPMDGAAKTGVVLAPYSESLPDAIRRVQQDIPGVMEDFATQQRIDLSDYELRSGVDDFTPQISLVAMAALS